MRNWFAAVVRTTVLFLVFIIAGCGGGGGSSTPTDAPTAPSAPTDVSAAEGKGQVAINWTAVPGAMSYTLYYGTTAGITTANGTKVANAMAPQMVAGLTDGTTYYFIVTAANASGESVASSEVHALPAANKVVSTGFMHSVAVRSDGTAWAWGMNDRGQLGDGATSDRNVAAQVNGLDNAMAITAGESHTVALKSDGTVWTWGSNSAGQLGLGATDFDAHSTPVQVSGLAGVAAVAASAYSTAVLKSDGTVWCWGDNSYGQLGDGSTMDRSTPVQVSGLTGVTAIAAGRYHTLALKSDGTVWAWGQNNHGALGDGTTVAQSTVPVQASGVTGIINVAAGAYHSLALKSDGTLWVWGDNSLEQLGFGTGTYDSNFHAPVQHSLMGVTAIAGAEFVSFVGTTDGTAWSWGSNSWDQLGYHTTTGAAGPGQMTGYSWVAVASSHGDHVIALNADGTVWAWGNNERGQLGKGNFNRYDNAPALVSGLSGV